MASRYENSKIYKIIGPDINEPCYVGSTTQPRLSKRMTGHVKGYRKWKLDNNQPFVSSFILFEKYGLDNCKIILMEKVQVSSMDELRMKEQDYIDKLDCVNRVRAFCSSEQKLVDKRKQNAKWMNEKYTPFHKQDKAKYDAEYRSKNIEKLKLSRQRKHYCGMCDYEIGINKRTRHDRTELHFQNTIQYMKSTIDKYTEQINTESNTIQQFSLE